MKIIGNPRISENRVWYNEWVKKNAKGAVLDIGKSKHFDYGFPTLDNNPELNPTYLGDICHSNISNNVFDTILCNGMYEFIENPQKMVNECIRMLAINGLVIFGFVGKGYYVHKTTQHRKTYRVYEEGSLVFPADIVEKKSFGDRYYFIICRKPFSKSKRTLADNL